MLCCFCLLVSLLLSLISFPFLLTPYYPPLIAPMHPRLASSLHNMLLSHVFSDAKTYLDQLHNEREEVIRVCRDVNSSSKKLIFLLHRATFRPPDRALVDAQVRILSEKLATLCRKYASSASYHTYKGTISNCVEELTEALLFGFYLAHGTLMLYGQLQHVVVLLIESYDYERKQHDEACLTLCIDSILVDVPNFQADSALADTVVLPGDYFMGIFDFTGELMRYTITQMAQQDATASKISAGVLKNLKFLRLLYSHVDSLMVKYPTLNVARGVFTTTSNVKQIATLKKKLEVFRQSIEKVETAVCSAAVTDSEPSMASYEISVPTTDEPVFP